MKSNIFFQEASTVEKLNIFDIESVTTEHPKNITKLSKPKLITKQQNKIKIYAESNAADRTLQLDIIKSHILFKNVHNVIKSKS